MPDLLVAGTVLRLGPEVGIQYRIRPITIRVIARRAESCSPGSAWVDAYELGDDGQAVARRDIFLPNVAGAEQVQAAGVSPKFPPRAIPATARTRPAAANTVVLAR